MKQLVTSYPAGLLGRSFRCHRLNRYREIPPEAVGVGIFDSFFSLPGSSQYVQCGFRAVRCGWPCKILLFQDKPFLRLPRLVTGRTNPVVIGQNAPAPKTFCLKNKVNAICQDETACEQCLLLLLLDVKAKVKQIELTSDCRIATE